MEPRRSSRADTGAPGSQPTRAVAPRPAASTWPAWPADFGRRLAALAVNPTTRAGLVGIALLFTGIGGNLMARTPAYYNIDETAHVGYLSSLANGRLPEIESRSTVEVDDPALASRLAVAPPTLKTVWVANHPPGAYLPAVPLAWLTNVLGVESALPVLLRLAGILAGLAALGFTYLLGKELANGDERAGLVAAALTACVPHLAYVSGTGLTDSAALAAGLAVTWMAVRMIRLGFTHHRTYWMAAFVTAAAFTRLTSAVLAVATVILLALLAKQGRLRFLATAALPAVALTGWFYLRIQRLYGDVAASEYLLGRFDLAEESTIPKVLTHGKRWDGIIQGLAFSAPPYRYAIGYGWYRLLKVGVIAAFVAVVATPIVRYLRMQPRPAFDLRRLDDRGTGRAGVFAAGIVALSVVLPFLFMAQHMAGGGGKHSRYLLPIVPPLTAMVARAIWLAAPKIAHALGIAVVAVAGIVDVQVLRHYTTPQFFDSPPALWTDPLLPPVVATAAATLAIVGFVVLIWSLAVAPDTHFFGSGTARAARSASPGGYRPDDAAPAARPRRAAGPDPVSPR